MSSRSIMASQNEILEASLPINCASLSLSALVKDSHDSSKTSRSDGISGTSQSQSPANLLKQTKSLVASKQKLGGQSPNGESVHSDEQKELLLSKRRSSLASQNPPTKVHKRKQNWESRKASVTYYEQLKKGFNLCQLRLLIRDVLMSKSYTANDVFKVDLYGKVRNVTVVFVCGLIDSDLSYVRVPTNDHFYRLLSAPHETPLSFLYNTFQHIVPMSLPANKEAMISPINVLLKIPMSSKEKMKRTAENSQVKLIIDDLLLTETEMRDNNYPIHSLIDNSEKNPLLEGWIESQFFEHDGSHTFAIDCEFCDAASGKVLTRFSMVNFKNEVVYDTYVKPEEEIIDYKTRYSGITKELLEGVETTLKDVQKKVASIISSSDVLIGHSLESDLKVLQLRHPRVIDSALVYEHHRGYPHKPGLKWLAEQYLNRAIQKGEQNGSGHSSVEDLNASLDLIKLKLMSGPDFGRNMETSIFKECLLFNPDMKARIIDTKATSYHGIIKDRDVVDMVTVNNDEEALDSFMSLKTEYSFNLVWFKDLKRFSVLSTTYAADSEPKQTTGNEEKYAKDAKGALSSRQEKSRATLLSEINKKLQRIYDHLSPGSVFAVCSDGGDMAEILNLHSIRRDFQKQLRAGVEVGDITGTPWDTDKQTQLQQAVAEARKALALVAVKE